MPPAVATMDNNAEKNLNIIYPPPEVRNIVDKTAGFVARNGPEFEQRIRQNEVNNPKFNFLNPGDPYHAYYEYKVEIIREGRDESAPPAPAKEEKSEKISQAKSAASEVVRQRQHELLKSAQKEQEPPPPKEPPAEFEFIADPPSISAFDLDVVKLTAQFVARNGRQFLTNLMNREQRNFQFDFLRPQHALFQYFTKLLEQYTKVLIPPRDMLRKISEEVENEKSVLDQIDYRYRWLKAVEAKKRKEQEEKERERVSYAQIDWHGFCVVETIDYQSWEAGNFPPPTNPTEVGARVLMQRRLEANPDMIPKKKDERVGGESNTNVEDMEEDSEEEETDSEEEEEEDARAPQSKVASVDSAPSVQQPAPALPTPGNVEVRKYDPRAARAANKAATVNPVDPNSEEFLISPITGERVPASKVQEHMRIGLLDPKWVEERDKQIAARAQEEQVFQAGTAIESSLRNLAERRSDIFGVGEDAATEAGIGRKLGEDEDGNPLGKRNPRQGTTVSEQIAQMNATKNLLSRGGDSDDGPSFKPQFTPQAPPRPPPPRPPTRPSAPPAQHQPPQMRMMPPPQRPPAPVMIPVPQPPPQQFFMPQAPPNIPPQGGPPAFMGGGPPMMMGGGVPPPGPPMMMQGGPGGPPGMGGDMDDGPSANKRAKGEESLIPEAQFAATNPSPVTFSVFIPAMADKTEWQLNGQVLNLTLPLSESVATIKSKIQSEVGMPPGKQKLQMDALFLKDANTLAYYNFRPGSGIQLQIKERGGRKK